ncbi:MAG TPA: gliding motility-associated C-terminal domain-containing protein, partial [Chitinophagaceae bacterium]|nr:gliding motility-associated C-terminal domain-containing protein [Chitinophagaceae bacterium]
PEDGITFKNNSTGNITTWTWSYGNSIISNDKDPLEYHFPIIGREMIYNVKLAAFNQALHCGDSITHQVRVLSGCFIAVPSAFTPNGDGLNDYLFPLNAVKAVNLEFLVFNRMGQLVFESRDWTKKWDGCVNGIMQNPGVYAWMLRFTHKDTGEKIFLKGTTALLR